MTITKTFATSAAFAALLTASALTAQGANLIKNGGFEKPIAPAGSYTCFNTGQTFVNWTVVGATGNVCVVSGTYTANGWTVEPEAGAQSLDLTGAGSNMATGVSQNVATTPGAAYQLTFWVGNVVDPGGPEGTTSTVNVLVNGVQVYTATNSLGAGSASVVWQKFTATITSLTPQTSIAFINGDPAGDNYNGLDGITLVPQNDAEPPAIEPQEN
jgi:uncharacterized protein DUF642